MRDGPARPGSCLLCAASSVVRSPRWPWAGWEHTQQLRPGNRNCQNCHRVPRTLLTAACPNGETPLLSARGLRPAQRRPVASEPWASAGTGKCALPCMVCFSAAFPTPRRWQTFGVACSFVFLGFPSSSFRCLLPSTLNTLKNAVESAVRVQVYKNDILVCRPKNRPGRYAAGC